MLFTPKLIDSSEKARKTPLNVSSGYLGQKIYVVPRAACSFRRFRLRGTSRSAFKAVELQAMNEAPPGHDQLRILKDQDKRNASVWSYSRQSTPGLRSLPESLCFKPLTSGCRLVECLTGVEGQIWDDNILVASRWWYNHPSATQWATFLRAAPAGVVLETFDMPTVETAAYSDRLPLIDFDKHDIASVFSPAKAAMAAGAVIAFATAYTSSQYLYFEHQFAKIEGQKTEVSDEANLILSKRRRALSYVSRIQAFNDIEPDYNLISGLSSLAQVFQGQDANIQSLRLRGDEIEFRMLGQTSIRVSELVSQLEQTSALANVSVTGNSGTSLIVKAVFRTNQATVDQNVGGN